MFGLDERVEVRAGGVVYPGKQQEGEKGEPQKEESNTRLTHKENHHLHIQVSSH